MLQADVQRPTRAVLRRRAGIDLRPERSADPGPTSRARWVAPLVLAVGSFLAYSVYAIVQVKRMAEPSWDLAIFTQIVQSYSHLHAPITDIRGPQLDALGDHFSPILAVLAPFYRLFPSPVTLQVAQAFLFAVAVVPITRVAMTHLGREVGVAIGVSYSLAWGIQSAVAADFHEIAFAVPLLAFAVEALLNERWRAAALWSVPLVLVKEDLGLTVAAIGVYLVIKRQRRLGALLIAGGIVAAAITVSVIIPALNPQHTYIYWGMVHKGQPSSRLGLLTHLLWPAAKLRTLLLLAAITGFVAIRSPLLVIGAPTLLWRFESANSSYWGTSWHYSAVLMPVVFAALVDGLARTRRSSQPWQRMFARYVPVVSVTVAVLLCVQFPLGELFKPSTYGSAPADANAAVAAVPRGSSVETDMALMTALVPGRTVYRIGDTGSAVPDYVAFDTTSEGVPSRDHPVQFAESMHPGTSYRLVFSEGAYDVVKKTS